MQAFLLDHRKGCTLTEPCASCRVLNHLRLSLDHQSFNIYLKLMGEAVVDIPDPFGPPKIDPEASVLDYIRLTNPPRKLLLQIAPTIGRLLEHTEADLSAKGLKPYTIKKIQFALLHNLGRQLPHA